MVPPLVLWTVYYYNTPVEILNPQSTCAILREKIISVESERSVLVGSFWGIPQMTPEGLFKILLENYGPQGWWPANSFDELCVGAILVQNTSWDNARKAISNLAKAGLISFEAIKAASLDDIIEAVYPAGTYRRKSAVLKAFSEDFSSDFGTVATFRSIATDSARRWLLQRKGIGFETADSILCYGAERALLVVDAYTRRLSKRLGWLSLEKPSYEAFQRHLQGKLPCSSRALGEFHALVVFHCKKFCKRHPDCTTCVLAEHCFFDMSAGPL